MQVDGVEVDIAIDTAGEVEVDVEGGSVEVDLWAPGGEPMVAVRATTAMPAAAAWLGPPIISLTVYGLPAPQGSKTPKGRTKTGRIVMIESSKKVKPWRAAVAAAARLLVAEHAQLGGAGVFPLQGALTASMTFSLPRPKHHYRTGRHAGQLRPDAPARPTTYPDTSKLSRSTEDALTRIIWRDDAQITRYILLEKCYTSDPTHPDTLPTPGVVIHLWHTPD